MKKIIIIIAGILVSVAAFGQKKTMVADTIRAKDAIKIGNTAVNEISTDTTFAGNSDSAVPTEKAVKTYVDNIVGGVVYGEFDNDVDAGAGGVPIGADYRASATNRMGKAKGDIRRREY